MDKRMEPTATEAVRRRTRLFMIGALVVAALAFAVIAGSGIGKNLVYYWDPTQLRAAGQKAEGATIRLGGLVREGSVVHAAKGTDLEFDVTDGKNSVHVKSSGVPPQMFREGIGVVVEGTMSPAGTFECNRLMVSHNNEYRAPGQGESYDSEQLIKSTQGLKE